MAGSNLSETCGHCNSPILDGDLVAKKDGGLYHAALGLRIFGTCVAQASGHFWPQVGLKADYSLVGVFKGDTFQPVKVDYASNFRLIESQKRREVDRVPIFSLPVELQL